MQDRDSLYPIEIAIPGTPLSLGAKDKANKAAWMKKVSDVATDRRNQIFPMAFLDERPLAATLFYFPAAQMEGDIDNIVKPILDALQTILYPDDRLIERCSAEIRARHGQGFRIAERAAGGGLGHDTACRVRSHRRRSRLEDSPVTSSTARYDSEVEARVLEELRPRYEGQGYRFVIHPDRSILPPFMHGYVPDAVATSERDNIAIEVKGVPSPGLSDSIERLRKLFVGRNDWKFTVVYGGVDPQRSIQVPVPDNDAIQAEIAAVEGLLANRHGGAALVMAFALLEATLPDTGDRRPRRPGSVVQTLAMEGLVTAEDETRLLALVSTRNRIVHGDLTARVEPPDVRLLLDMVKKMLDANGAVAG